MQNQDIFQKPRNSSFLSFLLKQYCASKVRAQDQKNIFSEVRKLNERIFTPAPLFLSCIFISVPVHSFFYPSMFLSYLFIPVSVYIYVSLFLVIHIYPFSCLYMLSLFLVIHIILVSVAISSSTKRLLNKIKKKMQMGINFKKCTYSPLSPGSYLCILFLFLVTHIYPCSHPQLEQKRLLNKIYKNIN